mmetsp:Transcript_47964/g.102703  ORF Transcript_47964/g.102703 Transcript_47964/m.102703 type:complete len:811 (+) Transcript_47964:118-2550(+)
MEDGHAATNTNGVDKMNGGPPMRENIAPPSPSGWVPKPLPTEVVSPNLPHHQRTSEVGSAGTLGSLVSGAASRSGLGKLRASSGTRTVHSPGDIRASYESALLQNIRRQVHDFEDRVSRQVLKIQQDFATFSKNAHKSEEAPTEAPLQRRVAELSGTVKGLHEEVQSQIGKINRLEQQTATSQSTFRQQIQSDLRTRFGDFEAELHKVTKSVKTTALDAEDNHKKLASKLLRLERDLVDHLPSNEDFDSTARMSTFEQRLSQKEAPTSPISMSEGRGTSMLQASPLPEFDSTQFVVIDGKLKDVSARLETLFQELKESRSQLAQQQVEISSVRCFAERREEQAQSQLARLEKISSIECELQRLQQAQKRTTEQALDQDNRLKQMTDRIDRHDELFEGRSDVGTPRKVESKEDVAAKEAAASRDANFERRVDTLETLLKDQQERATDLKSTIGLSSEEVASLRGKVENLASRVQGLVEAQSDEETHRRSLQASMERLSQSVQEHGDKLSEAHSAMQGALERGGRVTGRVDDLEVQTANISERLKALHTEVEALRELSATSTHSAPEATQDELSKVQETIASLRSSLDSMQRTAREEQEALELVREGTARAADVASNAADLAKQLRGEINELKDRVASQGPGTSDGPLLESKESDPKIAELSEKVDDLSKRLEDSKEAAETLRNEVTSLKEKVDLEGPSAADLEKALQEVKEDEEAEQESHKRLLIRIDDVCARLEEVDASVASMTKGAHGSLSNDFKAKFETLVKQVEAMRETEGLIKDEMGKLVKRLYPDQSPTEVLGDTVADDTPRDSE